VVRKMRRQRLACQDELCTESQHHACFCNIRIGGTAAVPKVRPAGWAQCGLPHHLGPLHVDNGCLCCAQVWRKCCTPHCCALAITNSGRQRSVQDPSPAAIELSKLAAGCAGLRLGTACALPAVEARQPTALLVLIPLSCGGRWLPLLVPLEVRETLATAGPAHLRMRALR